MDFTHDFDTRNFSSTYDFKYAIEGNVLKLANSNVLENLEKLTSKYDITDIGSKMTDFKETAAALMNLDLLICNDTSLAHLAGALGVPCFMIVPYEVNWRWHENHKKCDWYDSVKIFRQKSIGDWDGVFEDVKNIIQSVIKK